MAKQKKQPRPKAEPPKGFRDYFGAEVSERQAMLRKIGEVYHRYGFDPLETSAVETVEALGKFLPDVDRPNEGVFAFQEDGGSDDGKWLALRYDMTAPLARVAAQFRERPLPGKEDSLPSPYRRYTMGPVWRNEKPGPGRFRQFYQCDADTVGAGSVAADAEICAMLADCLEAVGIERGDYVVRVNNRKVLNGVMEVAGLAGDDKAAERGIVLRAIDKLDRLGEQGVRDLLGEGRKDESGDFTEGAGLNDLQIDAIMGFVHAKASVSDRLSKTEEYSLKLSDRRAGNVGLRRVAEIRASVKDPAGQSVSANEARNRIQLMILEDLVGGSNIGLEGVAELEQIADLLAAQGYGPDRIIIDPSVVRGLGYYTGPVYEAELTFDVQNEKGQTVQFGSVAGGGRYDDLVKRFTGQEVPATGVSIGVDRLLAALHATGKLKGEDAGPVIVTVMDRHRMAEYQEMVATLRNAGVRAEVYLGNPKNFGNQLKYADKRRSPVAIIQGSDEAERGVVQLKDLILGAKLAEDATLEEWKSQPAQTEVAVADLITEVQAIIARHQ